MDEAWRQKVRERAYAIWEREGCPEGQAERHWLMAEQELRTGKHADHPWSEDMVDEAGDESFPASDPPAWAP
jgi:hypothetical protein